MELDGVMVQQLSRSLKGEKTFMLKQLELNQQQINELSMIHQTKGKKLCVVWSNQRSCGQSPAVSKLSDELQMMKNERDSVRAKLATLNESHTHLSHQFEKLVQSLPAHVTMEEHQEVLGNIQR